MKALRKKTALINESLNQSINQSLEKHLGCGGVTQAIFTRAKKKCIWNLLLSPRAYSFVTLPYTKTQTYRIKCFEYEFENSHSIKHLSFSDNKIPLCFRYSQGLLIDIFWPTIPRVKGLRKKKYIKECEIKSRLSLLTLLLLLYIHEAVKMNWCWKPSALGLSALWSTQCLMTLLTH